MAEYFRDVYDHVIRASEWTESLRDLVPPWWRPISPCRAIA